MIIIINHHHFSHHSIYFNLSSTLSTSNHSYIKQCLHLLKPLENGCPRRIKGSGISWLALVSGTDRQIYRGWQRDAEPGVDINWHHVASHIPGRNNKECRKRWIYALMPTLRKGPWNEQEDALLLKGVRLHGLKWVVIRKGASIQDCLQVIQMAISLSVSQDSSTRSYVLDLGSVKKLG